METGTIPPPSVAERFSHIYEKIALVKEAIAGRTAADLAKDMRTCVAMERFFEIIGIASDHIPNEIKKREAEVDWTAVAEMSDRFGNVAIRVEPDTLPHWAHDLMPPLERCAARLRSPE